MRVSRGFSLIELMISSVLSLILLAVVIKLYQQHQATYRYQEGLARIQENARVAMHILHMEIQTAGYIGCGRIDNIKIDSGSKKFISANRIIGIYKSEQMIPGSDAMLVRHMNTHTIEVIAKPKKGAQIIHMKTSKTIKEADDLVLADCTQMQMVKLVEQGRDRINIEEKLLYDFSSQTQLGRLIESRFYLADTERKNSMGQSILSLYWMDAGRDRLASEIVEGVEKMKIRYGVLSSGGLSYQSAAQIKDWSKVRTVQIALLLSSIEPVLQKPEKYVFQSQTIQATDRILRREWTTQITLRGLL